MTIAVLTNQGVRDPSKIADKLLDVILPPLHAEPVDPERGGKPKPTPSANP